MSTGSICCHPDAIRCPSLWQRAVRNKPKTLACFQLQQTFILWPQIILGRFFFEETECLFPLGCKLRSACHCFSDRSWQFCPWKYGIWGLEGTLARLETGNHWAQFSPRMCFTWLAECFKNLKKIEVKFLLHKINHFKVHNSVAFSTFTLLYNHHRYRVPKHSDCPKRKLWSLPLLLPLAISTNAFYFF